MLQDLSWKWIAAGITLLVFPPLGNVLLVLLLIFDKHRNVRMFKGKVCRVLSYLCLCVGGIQILTGLTGSDATFTWLGAISIVCGIFLNKYAAKVRQDSERYKQYITLIVNKGITSIDHIASVTNLKHEAVMMDLQEMIESDFFQGAYIDEARREIVLQRENVPSVLSAIGIGQEKVVTCGCCGANNKVISGRVIECAYCGSPVQ